jgi:hypothetical protein
VEDFPNAVKAEPSAAMKRTLTLRATETTDHLAFRAAVADKIEALGDGWYRIQGEWKLRIQGGGEPKVRTSNGKQELIVPVKFADGKATLTQEFVW